MKIAITGSTGQLGRLVIEQLLKSVPAEQIVAIARTPEKAHELSKHNISVRKANYADTSTLKNAFSGIDRLLLIASNELGRRVAQHANVINAAVRQGVQMLAFTSLVHANRSTASLAIEYAQTEADIKASGLPHVILRNGWYTENYMVGVPAALASGTLLGCAGNGRISSACRADLAEAAAKILTSADPSGQTLELAGDSAYTLAELAAEISQQSGKKIIYKNLSETAYRDALLSAGFPEPAASMFATWDIEASRDTLFEEGQQLSKCLGHPTTPMHETLKKFLPPIKQAS
ncbi:MAG: SDR family oxidoreductase [Puniceicoccales bacterium]|jgi:NAD(P)H dehydrogenase (quinone)|nr:SDR family oxidoreductase [Puniceicoccales bacterium]